MEFQRPLARHSRACAAPPVWAPGGPDFPASSAKSLACHLPASVLRGLNHGGQLEFRIRWPHPVSIRVPDHRLAGGPCLLREMLEARLTFRWMGKDRSCWRGPSSVCSTLTSSEVESTTRASALRIAMRARVQGSRPRGKGSSSASRSAPCTTSTSGELAHAPDPPFLDPLPPPPSSRPSPGRAGSGAERLTGATDNSSGSRGLLGAP